MAGVKNTEKILSIFVEEFSNFPFFHWTTVIYWKTIGNCRYRAETEATVSI